MYFSLRVTCDESTGNGVGFLDQRPLVDCLSRPTAKHQSGVQGVRSYRASRIHRRASRIHTGSTSWQGSDLLNLETIIRGPDPKQSLHIGGAGYRSCRGIKTQGHREGVVQIILHHCIQVSEKTERAQ